MLKEESVCTKTHFGCIYLKMDEIILFLKYSLFAFKANTSPVLISSLSIESDTLRVGFLTTRILKDSVKPSTVAETVVLPVFFVSKFPKISNFRVFLKT